VLALAKAARPRLPGLRRVIVETTGVADPAPVAHSLLAAADGLHPLALDGIVCVADARHLLRSLDEEPVAAAQIATADVVVLSKADLATEAELARARAAIVLRNPSARVVAAVHGRVPLDAVLDLGLDDVRRLESLPPAPAGAADANAPEAVRHGDLAAVSLVFPGDLELTAFQAWLDTVLLLQGRDIVRLKGILSIAGRDRRFVFHGVYDSFDGAYGEPWAGEPRVNRVVAIGRGLSADDLQAGLHGCLRRTGRSLPLL
jgi:G3E family GTPase